MYFHILLKYTSSKIFKYFCSKAIVTKVNNEPQTRKKISGHKSKGLNPEY